MKIFLDFETNGLYGKVIEACAVDQDHKVIAEFKCDKVSQTFEKFMKKVVSELDEDGSVVMWHNFMQMHMLEYNQEALKMLDGRFVTMVDAYAIMNGLKKRRYTIQEVTHELLNRDHKGNAYQDACDLVDCFHKIQQRLNTE